MTAALVAALALAACGGSTVHRGSTTGSAPLSAASLAHAGGQGAGQAGGGTQAGPTRSGGAGPGRAPSNGPSVTTAGPGISTGVPGGPSSGPASSGGPIVLGIATFSDTGAVAAAGFKTVPTIEGQQAYDPVIKYVNGHGGFGGRQVRPIYFKFPLAGSTPYASEEQSACAAFTEDNHVAAVLTDRPAYDGVMVHCLAARNVSFVADLIGYQDAANLANFPMYIPQEVTGQRAVRNWIPGLKRLGYFSPGARIGLAWCGFGSFTAVEPTVPATLAAQGLQLTAQSRLDCGDASGLSSQIASSVLKFKASGVTHVLLLDEGPVLTLLWPNQAQSQSYYPRYGLNTFNAPSFAGANTPSAQFHGAVGIGWWPWEDVDPSAWPAPNSAASLCIQIFQHAGIDVSTGSGRSAALWPCGMVLFFAAATARTGDLSPAGLRAGVESLGSSWTSPNTFQTAFGPNHHDGAATYRNFAFADGCGCFKYLSNTQYPMQ